MKKTIILCALFAVTVFSGYAAETVIQLPAPQIPGNVSLNAAFAGRRTERTFDSKALPPQILADLLWAANGSNRKDGKRTIPAALGRYTISLYVILPEGIYRYDRDKNLLELQVSGDYRSLSDGRKMGASAGAVLLLAADRKIFEKFPDASLYIGIEAGAMVQNLYLAAAAENLHTVVCGSFDSKKIREILSLPENCTPLLTMVFGFPPEK